MEQKSESVSQNACDYGNQQTHANIAYLSQESVIYELFIDYCVDNKTDISNACHCPQQPVNSETYSEQNQRDANQPLGDLNDEVDFSFS